VADPATVAGAAAEQGSGGLPQFDLAQWPGQIVWMLVIFGVMFVLFAKVFVPKVGGTIASREDKVSGDIGDARRMKAEAEAQAAAAADDLAQARARSQKLAADAKAKAAAEASARQGVEDAKLHERLTAAEADIAAARAQAMTNVQSIAVGAAGSIVQKLTSEAVTAAEVKAALSAGQA
jgi:F-type H+-transporting ATPase subunit b